MLLVRGPRHIPRYSQPDGVRVTSASRSDASRIRIGGVPGGAERSTGSVAGSTSALRVRPSHTGDVGRWWVSPHAPPPVVGWLGRGDGSLGEPLSGVRSAAGRLGSGVSSLRSEGLQGRACRACCAARSRPVRGLRPCSAVEESPFMSVASPPGLTWQGRSPAESAGPGRPSGRLRLRRLPLSDHVSLVRPGLGGGDVPYPPPGLPRGGGERPAAVHRTAKRCASNRRSLCLSRDGTGRPSHAPPSGKRGALRLPHATSSHALDRPLRSIALGEG